jgi:hypothetical protein
MSVGGYQTENANLAGDTRWQVYFIYMVSN